jgi:hypothetical protein
MADDEMPNLHHEVERHDADLTSQLEKILAIEKQVTALQNENRQLRQDIKVSSRISSF